MMPITQATATEAAKTKRTTTRDLIPEIRDPELVAKALEFAKLEEVAKRHRDLKGELGKALRPYADKGHGAVTFWTQDGGTSGVGTLVLKPSNSTVIPDDIKAKYGKVKKSSTFSFGVVPGIAAETE